VTWFPVIIDVHPPSIKTKCRKGVIFHLVECIPVCAFKDGTWANMLINAKPKNEELKASYFLQLGIGI
jgi:hypothetical protein